MVNKNTKYLCLDKDGKTLYFYKQPGILLSWDKHREYDWVCPLDKKSINEYYSEAKSLTVTDFVYYYADELVNDWEEKSRALGHIVKLEEYLKKFDNDNFYYPFTMAHQLDDKSIGEDGGVDPREFTINSSCQLYSDSQLQEIKKSYAQMCLLFDNINELWQKIDSILKKYSVKSSTPIAVQYDGATVISAIYYHQLKQLLPGQQGVENYGEETMRKIRTHDYKIDKNGEWSARDTVFADIEITKRKHIKYLSEFELSEIQGSWLVPITLIEPVIKKRGIHYPSDEEFEFINKMDMQIAATGIFLGKTIKDFSGYDMQEVLLAQLKDGKVEKIVPGHNERKLKEYCEQINIGLEKNRLEKELVPHASSADRAIYKSKI